MRWPKPSQFLLLGSGSNLITAAQCIKQKGLRVTVATSERLLDSAANLDGEAMPFQKALKKLGVPLIESATAKGVLEKYGADAARKTDAFSFGAPWIFKKDFLQAFDERILNFHGTRLPRNRGGGGWSWAIMDGYRLGYCVAHQIDEGVDTGPVFMVEEFPFSSSCRIPIDYERAMEARYKVFLPKVIDALLNEKEFTPFKQPEYLSSYWPRLNTVLHGWIDWSWNAEEIERFICAFDEPYSGAHTFWENQIVHLKSTYVFHEDGRFHPFKAGIIYRKTSEYAAIAARGGSLLVYSLKDAEGVDLLPSIKVGERLHTPSEKLDEARKTRVFYGPSGRKQEAKV